MHRLILLPYISKVTFANPASAQAAVANPNPVIDGKTVNCNLASAKSNPAASSTGATAASSAPETPFLEIIRSQGEDISPEAVEYGIAQRYQTNPIDAFLFFLERAELFRGMPEFQYYSVNLLNAVKAYRSDVLLSLLHPSCSSLGFNNATALQVRVCLIAATSRLKLCSKGKFSVSLSRHIGSVQSLSIIFCSNTSLASLLNIPPTFS